MNTETRTAPYTTGTTYSFNQGWKFHAGDDSRFSNRNFDDELWSEVSLPHSNRILPHKDFHVSSYQFVSWYRKSFELPNRKAGQRVSVRFEGVMSVATVFVNGKEVGTHEGGYTPFEFDITDVVTESGKQIVAVRVDSTRHLDIPPEGFIVDYMLFGGMYRTASLRVYSAIHMEDPFIYTKALEPGHEVADLHAEVVGNNESEMPLSVRLRIELGRDSTKRVAHSQFVRLTAGEKRKITLTTAVAKPALWSVEDPSLYDVTFTLETEDGTHLDEWNERFGIRTIELDHGRLLLNGQAVKLRGLNRHQTYPYIGGAAPWRLQRQDAVILKEELSLNYVRTSHYPQDPSFLRACDELGLLVFTELPGWQHIGDEKWKQRAVEHLQELILRDRNHPSVFMWGVRINESQDDTPFYKQTNTLAHDLDPSRPTGGVRNFRNSEFLEDVFTFNDFSMGILPAVQEPQLITEFLGHMYPTKSYDPESRLSQHALYHAQIMNQVHARDDIMGASGWCAFDYNTHEHFGPGDMVCYHGVMDMFRQPKFAAKFYQSQRDLTEGPVLFAATYLTFATPEHTQLLERHVQLERMEHDTQHESYRFPIYIYTNCDKVEVEMNGMPLGIAQNVESLKHLPHPPKVFEIFGYRVFGEVHLKGYNASGECVATQVIQTPLGVHELVMDVGADTLFADGSDMTQVTVTAVDINGQRCPYANRVVTFDLEGSGELVGENPVAMEGGRIAIYVKATTVPGDITVTAKSWGVPEVTANLRSIPDNTLSL